MKKLLVLILVFVTVPAANAALQISVNGNMDPADSEFTIAPSDWLELDIWTDSDITPGVDDGSYALVAWTADAVISGGSTGPTPTPPPSPYDDFAGHTGIWGPLFPLTTIPAGIVIVDLIDFHCEWAPNDVLVELLFDPDYPIYGVSPVVDSVVIHQIPEPMTFLLLGLGGLFLRRRR